MMIILLFKDVIRIVYTVIKIFINYIIIRLLILLINYRYLQACEFNFNCFNKLKKKVDLILTDIACHMNTEKVTNSIKFTLPFYLILFIK